MATTITHDLSEIEKAFRAALLADTELVALLGSNTEIWREQPRTQVKLPSMIVRLANPSPQTGGTFTGIWWPEWQIDVLGEGPDPARKIHGYLEQVWSIPNERTTVVQSDWLDLSAFWAFSSAIEVGEVLLQSIGQRAYLSSRLYKSRVAVARTP